MILKHLKDMALQLLLIIAVTVLCATMFCTIFFPDLRFNISLLWQLLAFSLLCTLPGLIFCSKGELSKKQMRFRKILHLCVLVSLLMFFGYYWGWLDYGSIVQPAVIIILFAFSYLMVWYFTYLHEKNVAKQLNEGLKTFKQRAAK